MEPRRIQPKIVDTNNAKLNKTIEPSGPKNGSFGGGPKASDQSPLEPIVERPRKRRGLVALAIILSILLAAAASTSYYFYNKNKSETSSLNDQKNSLQGQLNQTKSELDTAKTNVSTGYYQITEWGVEFRINKAISDLYYYYNNSSPQTPSANFSSMSLINADPTNCNAGNKAISAPIGSFTRFSKGTDFSKIASGPSVKVTIGNYDYGYSSQQAQCSSVKSANDMQLQQSAALKQAFQTLRAIPSQ